MPKIVIITFAHLVVAVTSGILIGMMVFSVGFSDSETLKESYNWVVILWKILNAPASYVLEHPDSNGFIYIFIQIITSFLWANIYAFVWSRIKA